MNPELLLLKYLLPRQRYLDKKDELPIFEERIVRLLFKTLGILSDRMDRDLELPELKSFLFLENQDMKQEEVEIINGIFDELQSYGLAEDFGETLLDSIRRRKTAFKLAETAVSVADGKQSWDDLCQYVSSQVLDYKDESTGLIDDETFVSLDFRSIYEHQIHSPGIQWRLRGLQTSLGPLRRGDFGFLFARPESGKTTFLCSEVTCFASQVDSPIIWCNNEQAGGAVGHRLYHSALGRTTSELVKDIDGATKEFLELTKGNIRLYDSAAIHRKTVERMCEELKPSLLVFDQLDKIKGFDGEREDLRLGTIYQWARELAKSYCPVIGVTQADGTGEGKKWLTMDNVANAKTAKQAEADWILGIGKIHELGFEYVRYLNISKNKLAGDDNTDPTMRHARIECILEPEIGRFKDIG